jgi:microcystin-dependent protein
MELDLAVIVMFGGNFAMQNYAFCDGQLIAISQNTALFSILGTTYGGNGQTTFALPDLRGRVPLHVGNDTGPGLSPYALGEKTGSETVTLSVGQMPAHNHALLMHGEPSNTNAAAGASLSLGPVTGSGPNASLLSLYNTNAPNGALAAGSISYTGGAQPVPNIQPLLAVNFVIALYGIFPSRN